MFLVSFHGFWNARYFPLGESCAPEISGLPKINSRSISGGRPLGEVFLSLVFCAPSDEMESARHKRPLNTVFIATNFLSTGDDTDGIQNSSLRIVSAKGHCCPLIWLGKGGNFHFHFVTEIRYTTLAPSSDTSSEPSGATVTPTGRP